MTSPAAAMAACIRNNTEIVTPPLVPEFRLHLATEITPIWEATEAALEDKGLMPPFWAFAWPGGQALARLLLDQPDWVAGKRVLDFAAGCGLASLAAARAGAAWVEATEIDAFAVTAIRLNAALNALPPETIIAREADVLGHQGGPAQPQGWDVVLVGDVCYEQETAQRLTHWMRDLTAEGCIILLGDPGRSFCPKDRLDLVAHYPIPTTLDLEDATVQDTKIWRVLP